jgi:hypothetical protein
MSEDPTSPDAVARSMGLGGDLPPARPRATAATATVAPASATGLEVERRLPAWRRAPIRPLVVSAALVFSGYVFSWGDVEQESRVIAALAGGLVFFWCTLIIGSLWWGFRHIIGKPRPFGRTVFNYGLVGVIAALGILGADEIAG